MRIMIVIKIIVAIAVGYLIGDRIGKKVICSGSPMNPIDFRMRAKHNRKIAKPIVKYYEVKGI